MPVPSSPRPLPRRSVMAEPTPGPYQVERLYSNGCEVCPRVVAGKTIIAEAWGAPYIGFENTLSNARLLAASWNLLKACERFVADWSDDRVYQSIPHTTIEQARAAIAEATAEE